MAGAESKSNGFRGLSRRRLLFWGLGGTSVILMGGGTGLWALRGSAPAVAGLKVLSDHEYRTMSAIVHAVIPDGGAIPLGPGSLDIPRLFDTFAQSQPKEAVRDLKLALGYVEYGPLVVERRLVTFSNLPPAEREKHWELWESGDDATRRQIAIAFRKFAQSRFYDQEAAWQHIGYPGPWHGER